MASGSTWSAISPLSMAPSSSRRLRRLATDAGEKRGLEEDDGLDAGNFEAFPAAGFLTMHRIVDSDHVGAGLAEFSPVFARGPRGKRGLLGADDPPDRVNRSAAAEGAGQLRRLLLGLLSVEISLVHRPRLSDSAGRVNQPGQAVSRGNLPRARTGQGIARAGKGQSQRSNFSPGSGMRTSAPMASLSRAESASAGPGSP